MSKNFDNSESGEDIQSRWHRLLKILEVSRNHERISLLTSFGGSVARNPINDRILPSLLLLQFVSLFEDAAMQRIQEKGWIKKKKATTLNNLIQLLVEHKSVLDSSELHAIRHTRNDVAHNLKFNDWDYLVYSINIIEKELQKWGLIGNRPDYQFFAERSATRESEKESFAFAQDFKVGVKLDDTMIWGYEWTTMFG